MSWRMGGSLQEPAGLSGGAAATSRRARVAAAPRPTSKRAACSRPVRRSRAGHARRAPARGGPRARRRACSVLRFLGGATARRRAYSVPGAHIACPFSVWLRAPATCAHVCGGEGRTADRRAHARTCAA
eukprot:5682645-Prymnesium_polylepis.1